MTDYIWPDDLPPYAVNFYLQPHTGGSESPFTRSTKAYGLTAPRWICSMSFRGGYDGVDQLTSVGPRLDALIARLSGRLHRIALYDFRRPAMRSAQWPASAGNLAAVKGATAMTITGLVPGTPVYSGDYLGGDGRPHIIGDAPFDSVAAVADEAGNATVPFEPPLALDIGANGAIFGKPTGRFRLTDDDSGSNGVQVGDPVNVTLNFVEDLAPAEDDSNLLHGLHPIAYNVTDGGTTTTFTAAEVVTGLQIGGTLFNKDLLFSTGVQATAPHTRIILSVKANSFAGGLRLGVGIRDAATGNEVALGWQNNGWLVVHSNYGGGPSGNLTTGLATYAAGDTLNMQLDVTSGGELLITCQKNGAGKRMAFGLSGVPVGEFCLHSFDDTSAALMTFSLVENPPPVPVPNPALAARRAARNAEYLANSALFVPANQRAFPSGFTAARVPSWFKVYKRPGDRSFVTTADLQPILDANDPMVFAQYVDIATGSDTNPGTPSAPLKSIHQALDNAGTGAKAALLVKGGLYDYANCWRNAQSLARVLQVVSWDGERVISSMHDAGLTWSLDTGSTYQATFADDVVNVFDAHNLTADGDSSPLGLAASLALCRSTAGTYFVSSPTVYVHASDGRAPDANIRVYKAKPSGDTSRDFNGNYSQVGTLYMEDVHFEGGRWAFYSVLTSGQATIYGRNCSFSYAGGEGAEVNGDVLAIWQECLARLNAIDNFHYNPIFSTPSATGVEIDCISRWAGRGGDPANNSSSSHSGATIRVKTKAGCGDYHHAENRGIHDIKDVSVSPSSLSWCLGITSRDSRNGYSNFAVTTASGGAPKMWLDSCTSSGATNDLETSSGATIYTFDLLRGATDIVGGTITAYVP